MEGLRATAADPPAARLAEERRGLEEKKVFPLTYLSSVSNHSWSFQAQLEGELRALQKDVAARQATVRMLEKVIIAPSLFSMR